MKSIIIGLCTVLSVSACVAPQPIQKTEMVTSMNTDFLLKHHWLLVSAHDASHQPINDLQTKIKGVDALTLNFTPSRLSVTNTCNVMSGEAVFQKNIMHIGNMASSMKMCNPELMARERAVGKYLHGDVRVDVNDEHMMTLHTPNGAQLLFRRVATAESLYGKSTRLFLEIAPQTKPCHGMMPMNCLYVRPIEYNEQGIQTHAGDWTYFYDRIEGYTHKTGQSTVLRINRYEQPSPVPADASRYIYKLDMVVSQSIKQ